MINIHKNIKINFQKRGRKCVGVLTMFCFAKFCRLCLNDTSALINIFCNDKDNEKIVEKMEFLCAELISPSDGFPPWVCSSCRTQVNRSFNLFKKWIKSHETLQKYIRKCNVIKQVPNNTVLNVEIIGINFKLDKIETSISTDKSRDLEIHNIDESNIFLERDDKINKLFKEEENDNVTDTRMETNSMLFDKQHISSKNEVTNSINIASNSETSIETNYDAPRDNILAIGTDNRVIEELLQIVNITEDIQQEQQIKHKVNTCITDKSAVIEQLAEIVTDSPNVKNTELFENIFNIGKQNENQNIETVQNEISASTNVHLNTTIPKYNLAPDKQTGSPINNLYQSNILEKAKDSNEDLQPATPSTKENTFLIKSNLNYLSETAGPINTTIFSQISNDLQYNYYNNSNANDNFVDNHFQYTNYKASDNDNFAVDSDVVKKISGYLQESYPGSPSNVYCNLDDKMYYHNTDNLLETTSSSICSPVSDQYINNTVENKYMNNCTYYGVQTLPVNNSWNTFNQDLLLQENFTLLENVEKNLETVTNFESFLLKNAAAQNQVPQSYTTCYSNQNNMPYTANYAVDCNVYSTSTCSNNNINYNELQEEYSPTLKKDCFSFSEDSNGNEIPSKKTRLPRRRSKPSSNKENKFYQVFQDMEIASRHCNTPMEFTLTIEDTQITYTVDKNKSVYFCKTCNMTYQNISQILIHGSSMHNSSQDLTENEYLSINVAKPDKSVKLIVNHERKKFICKKCDKNFSEVAALYRHVAVHVSNQRYFCDECGKSFPVYRYLSLHKLIHSRIRVYACKLCPKTFRAKDTLRTHEIVHHEANQNKPFVCEICGKGFVIEQYLKIHMKRHNKETGRICHICGKILKNEELCYKHIKEKHLVDSLKECEICHKTFHANRNLKAHMKLHGSRDFKCDQCEKEFFFKRDLENHQLLHTGFRPHICHCCGKDFRSLGALYKHVRTHTKVKPHVCSICQEAFSQLSSLQSHERVHSGQKPYKCQQCGKSYVQGNVFQQHLKKAHAGLILC